MLIAAIVVAFIVLFCISVFLIWRFDRPRLWDHFARSLVQLAIAIATVFVAITLFDKQLDQRRGEDYQKQRQIVLSYLRSRMLEAQAIYKAKAPPEIASPVVKCDINLDQCLVDPDQLSSAVSSYNVIVGTRPSDLDVGLDTNRAEVWQLMRSAPLIDERHFVRIAEIFDNAYISSVPLRSNIKLIEERPPSELLTAPARIKAYEFSRLVLLQSRQIVGTLRAVCQLDHLYKEISSGTNTDYDDNNTGCPPHSTAYDDFIFTYWKVSRERSFKGGPEDINKKEP